MRKLRNMLSVWGDAGLVVRLRLTTGDELEGLVEEVDGDELVIEPVVDGVRQPIMVVMLAHVMTAQYTDVQLVGEDLEGDTGGPDEDLADEDLTGDEDLAEEGTESDDLGAEVPGAASLTTSPPAVDPRSAGPSLAGSPESGGET